MCGITVILRSLDNKVSLRKKALFMSSKLRHRGPDWSGICVQDAPSLVHNGVQVVNVLAHERLAIIDPLNGAQPLYNQDRTIALCVNGEIWNHETLRDTVTHDSPCITGSDCEPIIGLYEKHGDDFIHQVDGIFAFVLSDMKNNRFFAARDPIGVMSFYVGINGDGSIYFASELKALTSSGCEKVQEFPPGHFMSSNTGGHFVRWFSPIWLDEKYLPSNPLDLTALRCSLEKSVIKRLMSDVPYGVLLSGGLDSSLVASIVTRFAANQEMQSWWPKVHTFSIGLVGSPDLIAARKVATFLGTQHHEFHFTVEEGLDSLHQVIYHIETYDLTTIRASTPMYLLSRRIKAMGVKMVLSGEGADEVFGGYLYFHKAPNKSEFQAETVRKLSLLSKYDCLRANKSTAAWGVESREPFLDRDFLDIAMSIDPKYKMITPDQPMEKYILRKAFHTPDNPYLPEEFLFRQKEQFSDGVGYDWINGLIQNANHEVSDEDFNNREDIYPFNTPLTKEGFLYRRIFQSYFPSHEEATTVLGGKSIACSTPAAIEWDLKWKEMADPSGRAVAGVHVSANVVNGKGDAPVSV